MGFVAKVIASRKTISPSPLCEPEKPALIPAGRSHRRRQPLALGAGAAVLALVGIAWWTAGQRRAAVTPAASPATALHPIEARLLAAAAKEPGSPRPYLELAEEYAASSRPASALWAYGEAASRARGAAATRVKMAATLKQMGYPATAAAMLRAITAGGGPEVAQARQALAGL